MVSETGKHHQATLQLGDGTIDNCTNRPQKVTFAENNQYFKENGKKVAFETTELAKKALILV